MEIVKHRILDGIDPKDFEATLEANCLRPEEKVVKKLFEPDEIIDMRKQFMDNSIIIRRATEKLNKAKDEHKAEVKEPTDANAYLLANIRSGYVEVNQQVYLYDNQETGMMEYYDAKGELVESRRLTPEERQTRIS